MSDNLTKAKAEVLTFAAANPSVTPRIDERETMNGTTAYYQVEVPFSPDLVDALKVINHAKVIIRVEAYEGSYTSSSSASSNNSGNALLKLLGG
jgi:hypothetical protein